MPRFTALRALDDAVLPRLARSSAARLRALVAIAVVCLAAVVASAFYITSDPPRGDLTVGDVVRVGAVEGERVPAYTDRARAELNALVTGGSTAETYALVSLRGYVTPGAVLPVLRDVRTVRAFVRLPRKDVQTPIVSFGVRRPEADIPAAMARVAAQRDASAAEDEKSAAQLTGADPQEQQLRAFYQSNATLDRAEAQAFRENCACVYAVVVRATPVRLGELARRAGVRVVDAAPEVRVLQRTVFLPLLPEQAQVVAPPPDEHLPAAPPVR